MKTCFLPPCKKCKIMKSVLSLCLLLLFVFSGCTAQNDRDTLSAIDSTSASNHETTEETFAGNPSSDQVTDFVEQADSTSGNTTSTDNRTSSTGKPSSNQTPSTQHNPSQTTTQNSMIVTNKQVPVYASVNGRDLVVQATWNYMEGDTWSMLLKSDTGIRINTTYDVHFNQVEYLEYNGKAIVLHHAPVKKDDVISDQNTYQLETLAGPAQIQSRTMYDLINVEHATDNRTYRSWTIRKYELQETSKTTGHVVVSWIEVREYSKPEEPFDGTIVVTKHPAFTLSYTSEYGLYAGKTLEFSDGSKMLLGTDMYWFYLGNSHNKRVLCDDYRAYKSVPNDPNDSYWSSYWSMLN